MEVVCGGCAVRGESRFFSTRASIPMCMRPRPFLLMLLLVEVSRALRVFPAETRLTVYRRRPVLHAIRPKVKFSNFCKMSLILEVQLDAGGKPSTWFPPGRLVELFFCLSLSLSKNRKGAETSTCQFICSSITCLALNRES